GPADSFFSGTCTSNSLGFTCFQVVSTSRPCWFLRLISSTHATFSDCKCTASLRPTMSEVLSVAPSDHVMLCAFQIRKLGPSNCLKPQYPCRVPLISESNETPRVF